MHPLASCAKEGVRTMLELLRFLLEKLDFVAIADAARKRGNRRAAAQLHLILVQSYEIVELYGVLLDELRAALEGHQRADDGHRFLLNPSRIAHLLVRQSSNLSVIETLIGGLLDELRILDNAFAEAYREIILANAVFCLRRRACSPKGDFPSRKQVLTPFPPLRMANTGRYGSPPNPRRKIANR